ncbi:MAG: DUF1616 domain-containing protein [Candidatus Heimdallarchaeaceae archaeon]
MNEKEKTGIINVAKKILSEERPKTVKELVCRIVELTNKTEADIYAVIKNMEKENQIALASPKPKRKIPESFSEYLFKKHYYSMEVWSIFLFTLVFFSFNFLEDNNPFLKTLKIIVAGSFIIIIPGWSLTNVIFPRINGTIDQIERILISIGLSVGIAIFNGLVLNKLWIIDSLEIIVITTSITLASLLLSVIIRVLIGSGTSYTIKTKLSALLRKKRRRI